MNENINLTEEDYKKLEKDVTAELVQGDQVLEKKKEEGKNIKINVKNDPANRMPVGDLGHFDYATQEDIDEVFDKVDGVVFKMKKCLFRICYVRKDKRRFTAELINEEKK